MNIEVILTVDDPKLGKRGQIVKVSPGFAQNYLLPGGKARLATPATIKCFQAEQSRREKKTIEALDAAKELAARIEKASVTLEVSTGGGDQEKMFGAVTAQDIQQSLAAQGIAVEKKQIHLEEPIKKLGAYQVPVKPHHDVTCALKVWVVKKK